MGDNARKKEVVMQNTLYLTSEKVNFYCEENLSTAIKYAVDDFRSDVKSVLGIIPEYDENFDVYIGDVTDEHTREFLDNAGIYYADLESVESHKVYVDYGKCFLLGKGTLGTIFAIYEFCFSTLKILPYSYWIDAKIQKQDRVKVEEKVVSSFSFRFRTFAICDEDVLCSLSQGGKPRYVFDDKFNVVTSSEYIVQACKTALRLKYNVFVPATMLNIMNPHEEAIVKCVTQLGLYITQNFYEPLGVSKNTWNYYQNSKDRADLKPSYVDNKDSFLKIWEDYADKWSDYDNVIWQIGLLCDQDSQKVYFDERKLKNNAKRNALIFDALSNQIKTVTQYIENAQFFLCEADYLTSFLNDKSLILPESVNIISMTSSHLFKIKSPHKTHKQNSIAITSVNMENGEHLIARPMLEMQETLLSCKRNDSSMAYLYVGNVRERLINIYAFSVLTQNINAKNPFKSFSSITFDSTKTHDTYLLFNDSYVRIRNKILTDALIERMLIYILENKQEKTIAFTDGYLRSHKIDHTSMLIKLEEAMVKLLQAQITFRDFTPPQNATYFVYSVLDQMQILYSLYSFIANVLRLVQYRTENYYLMAVDEIQKIKLLLEKGSYGKWSGGYRRASIHYQAIINSTKELL